MKKTRRLFVRQSNVEKKGVHNHGGKLLPALFVYRPSSSSCVDRTLREKAFSRYELLSIQALLIFEYFIEKLLSLIHCSI